MAVYCDLDHFTWILTDNFNIFNELYNKNFPIVSKKVSKKSILKPWVSPSLTKKIKIKDNLGRLASKGRIDRETFTRFRN